jgi:probable rRNA maturation factor
MQFPDLEDLEPHDGPRFTFHHEDVACQMPDSDMLIDWLTQVAEAEQRPLQELNYIFCSDEYLRGVNQKYLNHDYYTDVITFPYSEDTLYGDIFISVDRVQENAATEKVSFHHELCRVMVHGLLHLAGYRDESDAEEQEMRTKENLYLSRIEQHLNNKEK